MVSTHWKNISQIGSFPQVGARVKIKNLWNHHPSFLVQILNAKDVLCLSTVKELIMKINRVPFVMNRILYSLLQGSGNHQKYASWMCKSHLVPTLAKQTWWKKNALLRVRLLNTHCPAKFTCKHGKSILFLSRKDTISHRIHAWYICLHLVDFYDKLVGKYNIHGWYGNDKTNINHIHFLSGKSCPNLHFVRVHFPAMLSNWWFSPTHLKNMLVKLDHFSRDPGWKFQKIFEKRHHPVIWNP